MKVKETLCLLGLIVLLFSSTFLSKQTVLAAKDQKKPTITIKTDTNDYAKSITLKITAKDSSGINELKYTDSKQKASYFKKKGTKLTLKKNVATLKIKENGVYTFYAIDKAGNAAVKSITISQIDTTAPVLTLSDSILNQTATIYVNAADLESGISESLYLSGEVAIDSDDWEDATDITGKASFTVDEGGIYTVKVKDQVGNASVQSIDVTMELKAMWISYLEFASTGYTKEAFQAHITEMFDRVVELNMNAVIVQVRPFSDALYTSKYFPWSKYVSGTQGTNPGYDPLKIMIEEAHARGLEFHAWLNPYRVTSKNTDLSLLDKKNPAKKWLTDSNKDNDRYVLTYDGSLYYNPSIAKVRTLIVNGVKEIVQNYDVDGIHFDDYFYPSFGSNYKTVFDAQEYDAYVTKQEAAGKTVKTIADWRRGNVNTLVKAVYSAVKEINPKVAFGISPQGNLNNLRSNQGVYVDIDTWLSKDGYVDYICPQIYWTFENKVCPFDDCLDQWLEIRTNNTTKIYAGIATYKAGSNLEDQWKKKSILADMVEYSRDTEQVDGFMFFRYDYFNKKICQSAVNELVDVLED